MEKGSNETGPNRRAKQSKWSSSCESAGPTITFQNQGRGDFKVFHVFVDVVVVAWVLFCSLSVAF
jgi:hypothetical protein